MTCKADIPPAWVACIQSNICPGCAGPIMDDSAKELLTQLREAMSKMPNDPEGLAGWLMSNYDLFPKGSVEPTNFHRKPPIGQQAQMDGANYGNLKVANSPSQQFMKRAGADKVMNPKLAAIAQAINSANAVEGTMYGGQQTDDQDPELNAEEQEMLMQQQMQDAAAKARAKGRKLTMKEALENNVVFGAGIGDDGPPLSEAELIRMQEIVGGPSNVDPESDGLELIPPALRGDRLKRLEKQRDLMYGGSSGKIKRSE